MATVRILLGIICFAAVSGYRMPNRHLLSAEERQYQQLLNVARGELGIREKTGHNDGEAVERYLASVGLKKGDPWCAAFISWIFKKAGYPEPRTGWSPSLFNGKVNTRSPALGFVFGIWFPELKRIAHVGLVEKLEGDWLISIEGNTNIAGCREGDGVYRKRRHRKSIHSFANWLKGQEVEP